MKRILTLLLAISVVATSFASGNSLVLPKKPSKLNASEILIPLGKNHELYSLIDISRMKVKDIEAITGKKFTLGDKIKFLLGQKQLRNSINADGTINKKFGKASAIAKKMNDNSRHYLKLWLILLGVSIVLGIIAVAAVSPAIWIISALAGLGALVFFVLWLIALAG